MKKSIVLRKSNPYYINPRRVPDEQLRRFAAVLAELIQPSMVYLMTYADPVRHDHIYHDLLFCTGYLAKIPPRDGTAVMELFSQHHPDVGFSLLPVGTVEKHMKEGAVYYRACCSPRNLIWCAPGTVIDWPETTEAAQPVQQRFEAELAKAVAFLDGALQYRTANKRNDIAAFMLQQSAELTGRAVLLALTGHEVKTHSLLHIMRRLMSVAGPLCCLFPADTEEELRLMNVMDDAYLQVRYGQDFDIQVADLLVLEDRVQQLVTAARDWVGLLMGSLVG